MLTKTAIEQYFIAEKNTGLFFLIAGIIAITAAVIFFFFIKISFWRGAVWPLLIIGLIQIIAGYVVFSRSDKQRVALVYAFDLNPDKIKTEELPGIKKAVTGLQMALGFEILLLVAGAVLLWTKRNSSFITGTDNSSFWAGIAIALIIQALICAGVDYTALKRAKDYAGKLEQFAAK